MNPKRETCAYCERSVRLRKDGTLGAHPPTVKQIVEGADRYDCPGSGKLKVEACPYLDPSCHLEESNGFYFPCARCYEDEGRPPLECQECANGSKAFWAPDWGWVHADEGAPMPMPCPNKIA